MCRKRRIVDYYKINFTVTLLSCMNYRTSQPFQKCMYKKETIHLRCLTELRLSNGRQLASS